MKRAATFLLLIGASISRATYAQDEGDEPDAPSAATALGALTVATPKEPEEVPRGFSVKVWGGPSYHQVFSVPITSGDVGLALGAQLKHVAIYGGTDLLIGRTELGLKTTQVRSMASIEARYGRWRIGAGIDVTYFAIERATIGGVLMDSYGAGLTLLGSVDLVRTERGRALYLGASLGEDLLVPSFDAANNAPMSGVWGATVGLGVRY